MTFMRFILKMFVLPFALLFTIVAAFLSFLLSASAFIFSIASTLAFIASVILFIAGEPTGGIAFMVVAFLVSPYGLYAIAGWLVGLLNGIGGSLRGFIIS